MITKAIPQWRQYLAIADHGTQGVCRFKHYRHTSGKALVAIGEAHYALAGDCAIVTYKGLGQPEMDGQVFAQNKRYAFELRRRTAQHQWVLTRFVSDPIVDKPTVDVEPVHKTVRAGVCAQFSVESRWLPEWLLDPDLTITDLRADVWMGQKLARVSFRYSPRLTRNNLIRSGWLLLDPSDHWLLRAYECHLAGDDGLTAMAMATLDYTKAANGQPVLTRLVREITSGSDKRPVVTYELDLEIQSSTLTEEPFTLGAFGIREPAGAPTRGEAKWQWLFWLGLICLLVGMVWTKIVFRRRALTVTQR